MLARFRPSFFWNGIALALWVGTIFFFSALEGSPYPFDPPLWYILERKGAHVFEYAVLTLLLTRFVTDCFPREPFRKVLAFSAVCALSFAASDELHQFFVPYRGAKISDVLIDSIGVFGMAGMLLLLWQKERGKKNPR